MRVACETDGERAIDSSKDACQVDLSNVGQFAEHLEQLLYLLEFNKVITLDTHCEDVVHRVGDSLEHIAIGLGQRGIEQLGILAVVGCEDLGIHRHTFFIKVDKASDRVDVALGENTDERHLLGQFAINVTLVQDCLEALALNPGIDFGAIVVKRLLGLLVFGNAGCRVAQDGLSALGGTGNLHRLVDRAHEQHFAIDSIQVVAHIHAIQALYLSEVTAHTHGERLAGLVRVVKGRQDDTAKGLDTEVHIGFAIGIESQLRQVAEQDAQG